jgi:hypothetical protein
MPKTLSEKKTAEIMKRLLQMPHKPHVAQKPAKKKPAKRRAKSSSS